MTREQLNTYIDQNVTDKTAPDSLSPTDEGNALKAVADYVDQEILMVQPKYTSYVAEVNYNSVVNAFIDEIGFNGVSVSNPSNGKVVFTKTNVFLDVDPAKICFLTQNLSNSGQVYVTLLKQGGVFGENPNDKMTLNIFDMTGAQTGTPSGNVIIEVRIYN